MTIGQWILALVLLSLFLALYFLPSIAAKSSHHPQTFAIFILNFFLGWTLLGWVGALVWACIKPSPPLVLREIAGGPAGSYEAVYLDQASRSPLAQTMSRKQLLGAAVLLLIGMSIVAHGVFG